MKSLLEIAATLKDLLAKLSALVSDRRDMAQQLLDAAVAAKVSAGKIASLEAEIAQLKDSDAATDAEQAAAITAEYEGKIKAAEEALAAAIDEKATASESIGAIAASIEQLLA